MIKDAGFVLTVHSQSHYRLFFYTDFLTVLTAETQQGIFDAVLKGGIDFDSDPWPVISDSAKDLIRKMLNPRPAERLTAHEVLC